MARLLFITQKIDKNDDILGVYHRWVEEFSKRTGTVSVICLCRGEVDLPDNVSIYSLGKESGESLIKYVYRFYKYIWDIRNDYDVVFVHMNPVYVVLGGIFWKLTGKKIFLWYNHPMGNLTAKIGAALADKVFCTSPYSFSAKFKKTELMPAGIDTDLFKPLPGVEKVKNRILSIGRISPIKKLECLIEAAKVLDSKGVGFELLIVGSPVSQSDKIYENKLKKTSADLLAKGKAIFKFSVPNYKTPEIYNSCGMFVNLTPTGSFDKTILEAMACGLPVIASNKAVEKLLPSALVEIFMFKEGDNNDLSSKLFTILSLQHLDRQKLSESLRKLVVERHSLTSLMDKLTNYLSK